MNKLIIDSSTKYLYVCLIKDNEIIEQVIKEGNNDHSKKLMLTIIEIMDNAKMKIKDLHEIISGSGPGSYTGIRVCISIAKMLAFKNNIKLKTMNSLKIMSSNKLGFVAVIISTRNKFSYNALYKIENKIINEIISPKFSIQTEFLEEVKKYNCEIIKDDYQPNPNIIDLNSSDKKIEAIYLREV